MSNVKDVLEKYSDEISWFTSERQFLDFAYQYGMIGNTWKSKNENKYNFHGNTEKMDMKNQTMKKDFIYI